ncbi:NAD(P)-dependent oxidoreductase [Luteibacter aegosomaticola]|uniref:NAD(P)-dependent oxidoreductase n=1 Tax=Luteibacter aegosomaticola TaxID=2911538 RepID=UPI001FFAEDD1|nr:NAD(P)-dependent oxidoreductase [Luteibacter aegosomaticola]UPG91700.1 NAD(P)-dependent oxidoreductase [Luteibacter aegosomaticola]
MSVAMRMPGDRKAALYDELPIRAFLRNDDRRMLPVIPSAPYSRISMNIVLFGATGNIGKVILQEALDRGHHVTAIVRDPSKLSVTSPLLKVAQGDLLNPSTYAAALTGAEAAIASVNDPNPDNVPKQAETLLAALSKAGVKRFAWVGGAGSLEVAPGVRVIDDPNFPAAWKPSAMGMVKALEVFRASKADIDWTFISPAAHIEPGERTGKYRVGGDQLLVDAEGNSRISQADYAIGLLDRLEKGDAARKRITLAY